MSRLSIETPSKAADRHRGPVPGRGTPHQRPAPRAFARWTWPCLSSGCAMRRPAANACPAASASASWPRFWNGFWTTRQHLDTLALIEKTARVIAGSADCAIGFEAAAMVLQRRAGLPRRLCRTHCRTDRCYYRADPAGAVRLHVPGARRHPGLHCARQRKAGMPTRCASSVRTTPSRPPVRLSASIRAKRAAAAAWWTTPSTSAASSATRSSRPARCLRRSARKPQASASPLSAAARAACPRPTISA